MLDQGGDVFGHELEAQWAINVGCAPVGLQIDGDDLPILGEEGSTSPNISIAPTPPCSRIERLSGAVDLVVKLRPIHGSIVSPCVLVRRF